MTDSAKQIGPVATVTIASGSVVESAVIKSRDFIRGPIKVVTFSPAGIIGDGGKRWETKRKGMQLHARGTTKIERGGATRTRNI